MAWFILILSGVFESVWTSALSASEGLTRPGPTITFFVFAIISMIGLAWALQTIPMGTGYAVWSGTGAALTVAWSMATGQQEVAFWPIVFLAGIILAIVGLRLAPAGEKSDA